MGEVQECGMTRNDAGMFHVSRRRRRCQKLVCPFPSASAPLVGRVPPPPHVNVGAAPGLASDRMRDEDNRRHEEKCEEWRGIWEIVGGAGAGDAASAWRTAHAAALRGCVKKPPWEHRGDREVMLEFVKVHGVKGLHIASEDLKNDRGFVLAAVEADGHALLYAPAALQDDRGIVMVAVASRGRALQYASERLRRDRDVVLAAVAADESAVEFALDSGDMALGLALPEWNSDREFVLRAVRADGKALQQASAALRDDRDIVLAAVASRGEALGYASYRLRRDREVVFLASVQSPRVALDFADPELRADREFVDAVTRGGHLALDRLRWLEDA